MIRTGPRKRETQGNVDSLIEGMELKGYQALVVIHAQNAVELTGCCTAKDGVRRMGPRNFGYAFHAAAKGLHGREDDANLFGAKIAALTGVRVQTCHSDARQDLSPANQEIRQKPAHAHDLRRFQEPGNISKRNVRRDESHRDPSASQTHGVIGDAAAHGKKFRLTGKRKSRFMHCSLGDGSGNHCLNLSRFRERNGLFQGANRMLGGGAHRLSRRERVCRSDYAALEASGERTALQGGAHDFRPDAGRISQGDPDPHILQDSILMYAFWRSVSSQRCWAFMRSC